MEKGRLIKPIELIEEIKQYVEFNNLWKEEGKYHIKNGRYTVTKSIFGDIPKYSIYIGDDRQKGVYETAVEAKDRCYEINIGFVSV